MKKIEIIIKPENLEVLMEILEHENIRNFDIVTIMDYAKDNTVIKKYRGAQYQVNMISKLKAEVIADDDVSENLIVKIVGELRAQDIDSRVVSYECEKNF